MWALRDRYELLAGQVPERELAHGNPPWLVPELVATPYAIERLRRWAAGGGFDQPMLFADDIREQLQFAGDEEIRERVVSVLARMAPPVRDHLLATTLVVGVGQGSLGWVAKRPEPGPKLRIMALAGDRDENRARATIAHEIAHTWLLADPPHEDEPIQEVDTLAFAMEIGAVEQLERIHMRDERLAAHLARAWGFNGPAADAERCAAAGQRAFRNMVATRYPGNEA